MSECCWKCFLIAFFAMPALASPRLALDSPSVDFGEVAANAALVREVRIGNAGDAPLRVSRVKACCGAKASLAETEIPAGTSSVLRVELNPGANPGPFRKAVTLYSDDPKCPVLILPLTGAVKGFVPRVEGNRVVLAPEGELPAAAPPAPASLDISLPVVLFAGFVDGFNPCAFSIVIVLAGVLAAGGRRRRARLLGGAAFCAGSYLTYMAMGFGLLSAFRALSGLDAVRDALFAVLSLTLLVLSVLSFRDAWRYRAARVPAVITLQLPDGVKRAIRAVAEASWAGPAVVGTGLLCGFVVTLLDSLCTGQVYVPVLAMLARDARSFRALVLLALYNLAFIAPLVAVFVLAAKGADSARMSRWSKRNVVPSKVFLALVFALLAALLFPRNLLSRAGRAESAPKPAERPYVARTPERRAAAEHVRRQAHAVGGALSDAELADLNMELDLVVREDPVDPALVAEIVRSAADPKADPNWRNYCVQVLPECWLRLKHDEPVRGEALRVLRASLRERATLLPGTALLGLGRLAEADGSFADEFANALLAVASSPDTLSGNRVSALSLAADRGLVAALPSARHWEKSGETPLLRDVAAKAVRTLEGKGASR